MSGHIYLREGRRGRVWYAKWRAADGTQHKRALGPAWTARSRPPDGHLTRREAEAKLQALLVEHARESSTDVSFREAAQEWLRYIAQDRKRRHSTVVNYELLIQRCLDEFGEGPGAWEPEKLGAWVLAVLQDGLDPR